MKIVDNVLIRVVDDDIPADGCFIIPDTVKAIGPQAFARCDKLITVTIPSGVTCLEVGVFLGCTNLQSVSLPESLTSIGQQAFRYCKNLSELIIPQGVIAIGTHAFSDCKKLTAITIPQGVKRIEQGTFWGCNNLHSVSLPESLTIIASHTFYECKNLSSVIIPQGVTAIYGNAFWCCENLTTVTIPQGIITLCPSALDRCDKLAIIVVDADTPKALQLVKNQLPPVLQNKVLSKEEYERVQHMKKFCLTNYFLELIANKHIKSLSEVLDPILTHSFFSVMPTDLRNTLTPYVIELHPAYQELAKLEIPVLRDDQGTINWDAYQKRLSVELAAYFNNHFLPTNAKQAQPASHDVSVEVTKELPSDARISRR